MTTPINTTQDRDALRKHLRAVRKQLDPETVSHYSQRIAHQLYPLLSEATHVAAYLALGNEVNVSSLLVWCHSDHKHTYIPVVIEDNQMLFMPYDADTPLVPNRYGILEPVAVKAVSRATETLDAVIVPLVGFDESCNRMGMGGGYYDRAFAHQQDASSSTNRPLLIGVAFDEQQVDSVFADWWDVPLDFIVTQSKVHKRG